MTAFQRRLELGLVACAVLAFVLNAVTSQRSTGQTTTAQPSTSLLPFSSFDPIPRIAIAYDVGGRGTAGFNELAWEGVKRAAGEFDAEIKEITAGPEDTDADREQRLSELADDRYYPIFAIGSSWAGPVAKVAPKYPGTWFGIVDDGTVNAPKANASTAQAMSPTSSRR